MKYLLLSVAILFLLSNINVYSQDITPAQQTTLSKSDFFIENKGQWPDEVRYLAKIGGQNCWI